VDLLFSIDSLVQHVMHSHFTVTSINCIRLGAFVPENQCLLAATDRAVEESTTTCASTFRSTVADRQSGASAFSHNEPQSATRVFRSKSWFNCDESSVLTNCGTVLHE
jgi:hypothetical protein